MQMLGTSVVRAFCIPEDAVRQPPRFEGALLFLAIALMASLGIRVEVTTEGSTAASRVLRWRPARQAIIANWVRGDGRWHVDVTGRTSLVSRFTEVAGDVNAHSAIEGP